MSGEICCDANGNDWSGNPVATPQPGSRKLHIVWNEAKNEGVVFIDDEEGRRDARTTANRARGYLVSTIGQHFAETYDDDELTLETVEVATASTESLA